MADGDVLQKQSGHQTFGATPTHASRHANGGADVVTPAAILAEPRMAAGTLAARPAAATFGVGYYLATDTGNEALYHSDASAWTAVSFKNLAALLDVAVSGIANGQLLAWNSSTGKFEPSSPTGNAAIDYAENVSVTGQTVAGTSTAVGTAVDLTSCTISIPAQTRPTWIEAQYTARQSALGNGTALIQIKETTSGVVDLAWAYRPLPNSTSVRGREFTMSVRHRIGASTSGTRTFKLSARCDSVDATVPSFVVLHLVASPSFLHAWSE